jgi:hypothetical protein
MTEAEWLACTDPAPMLGHLRGKTSDRRLRLFAVACCRRIWKLMVWEPSRQAVAAAERFAEGMAREKELAGARHVASRVIEEWGLLGSTTHAAQAATNAAEHDLVWVSTNQTAAQFDASVAAAAVVGDYASQSRRRPEAGQRATAWAELKERSVQSDILRDIMGNPFRYPVLDPAWTVWNRGIAWAMANVIDEGQTFRDLPVLADALEEAGCADQAILGHCRGPGPHVGGCWVVDLLLGKE